MLILGIDPGATGAAALVNQSTGNCIAMRDLCASAQMNAFNLRELRYENHEVVAVLEKAQPMPRQGVVSVFGYGKTCGIIEGILASLKIRIHFVAPGKWKRDLGLARLKDEPQPAYKGRSLDMARRLFPDQELHLQKHHNRAEALLIAEWARRFLFNVKEESN